MNQTADDVPVANDASGATPPIANVAIAVPFK